MKIVKKIFNVSESRYNILLDFLGLCYLFGNDHIPSNSWFGSEFTFEEIILILKESYTDNNDYMIKLTRRKKLT